MAALGRVFSRDKLIDNAALNLLGVQVARTVAARLLYNLRRPAVPDAVAGPVAALRRDGIAVLEHFLTPDRFEQVREDCDRLDRERGISETYRHGSTTATIVEIGRLGAATPGAIRAFFDDPRLCGIFSAAEQTPLASLLPYGKREHLAHGPADGDEDPQTRLHSDIFFNTHKAWFYVQDVTLEDGPLAYVKGSHRLSASRLGFVYRDSWSRQAGDDPSRRIPVDEQQRFDVQETVLTCRANTLVVVNTCGYHRRLVGQPGHERSALHLSVRTNPFAPHSLRARIARHPRARNLLKRMSKMWRQ